MKKLSALLLCFSLGVFAVGCGGAPEPVYEDPGAESEDPDAGVVIEEEAMSEGADTP